MTSFLDWKPNFNTHVINIVESTYTEINNSEFWNKANVEKCFSIINTNKFKKLDKNPTVSYEAKTQRTLRKAESRFTLQEYSKVYPTGSNAGKLYGTAKIHKLPELGTVD